MNEKEVKNKNILGNIIVVSSIISIINALVFFGNPNNLTSLFITFLSLFILGMSLLVSVIRDFNKDNYDKFLIVKKDEYKKLEKDIKSKDKIIEEQNKLIKRITKL